MIGFAHSLKPVGFRVIETLFLNFLSQKTYQVDFQDQRESID